MDVIKMLCAVCFIVMLVAAQATDQHGNNSISGKLRELLVLKWD